MKIFIRTTIFTVILMSLLTLGFSIGDHQAIASGLGIEFAQTDQNHGEKMPDAIAKKILTDAAESSGMKVSELKITQVESQTFSNPCRFNFGEICTEEYNPVTGWEVIVKVQNQSWNYHVNQSGSQIILDPQDCS